RDVRSDLRLAAAGPRSAVGVSEGGPRPTLSARHLAGHAFRPRPPSTPARQAGLTCRTERLGPPVSTAVCCGSPPGLPRMALRSPSDSRTSRIAHALL